MTIEEYRKKLDALTAQYDSKAIDSVVVPAASELLATIKNRIVLDGKKSNNSSIGKYSTRPAYFGPEDYMKGGFTPKGKTGESEFKNGKPHKTEYFPTGYDGLRDKQGLRTDIMNLSYHGSTLLAYQMQPKNESVVIGLTTQDAANIRKWQELKRGAIFSATDEEIKDYTDNVRKESERVTRALLK